MQKKMQTGVRPYGSVRICRFAPGAGRVYHPQASSPPRRKETLIHSAQKCLVYASGEATVNLRMCFCIRIQPLLACLQALL